MEGGGLPAGGGLRPCPDTFRNVIDSADDHIFTIDESLSVTYTNHCSKDHFKCSSADACGRALRDLLPPEAFRAFRKKIQGVFASCRSASVERIIEVNGRKRWINTVLSPISDASGRVTSILGVCRDVTEQKEKEDLILKSKAEWLRAIDGMPHLLAVVDSSYRLKRVNRAMAEKLGVSVQGATRLLCYETICADQPLPFCPLSKSAVEGGEQGGDVLVGHFGGDYLVSVSSLNDNEGKAIGCIFVARPAADREGFSRGRNEELIRALIRDAEYLFSIQDAEGRYLFFGALPVLHRAQDDIPGKTPFCLYDSITASRIVERVRKSASENKELVCSSELRLGGEVSSFVDQLFPLMGASGRPGSVVTISKRIPQVDKPSSEPDVLRGISGNLTKREREIIRHIGAGLTNSQIAERLYISKKTVETHRARIMQKLNIHKTSALVKYAIEAGLL